MRNHGTVSSWARRLILALVGVWGTLAAQAQTTHADNVVLVTIDGFRWQDLFRGADPSLVESDAARASYVDAPDRAQALAPFLLSFAQTGALIGNRDQGSCARMSNEYWFSYPGYAELLAGRPNSHARSNRALPNEDVTVLERLSQRPDFAGSVRAYAEWSVVKSILNVERSQLPVFVPPDEEAAHDPQVMAAAREIFGNLPRVTWLALGDTDNRAHEGDYDAYLAAAHEADAYVQALWNAIEADPRTAGRTTMIVTADHGRGESEGGRWRGHGSGHWRGIVVPGLRHKGSDAIFIAARGPGIVATDAYDHGQCASASQVAGTLLQSLGLLAEIGQSDMAAPLAIFGGDQ